MSTRVNRRIQFQGPSAPLHLVKADLPKAPPHGLVVKTEWAGICHSDVHMWHNKFRVSDDVTIGWDRIFPGFNWKWPVVMGHEISGRVWRLGTQVGDNTCGLSVGDRVVVFPWIGCGRCDLCRDERSNLCNENNKHEIGCSVYSEGGYQDYVPVRDVRYACKLPDSIPGDMGCLLGCSALTALTACRAARRSVDKALQSTGRASILVIGAGGLGQWAISFIKALFPKQIKVFAADASEENLEVAKNRGATGIYWSREAKQNDVIALSRKVTTGVDAVIDFVGTPAMLERAFSCANKNATLVVIGIAGGTGKIPLLNLVGKNITLLGNFTGNLNDMKELIQLCSQHPEIRPPAISHIKPHEVELVFRKLDEGVFRGRAIIDFRQPAANI